MRAGTGKAFRRSWRSSSKRSSRPSIGPADRCTTLAGGCDLAFCYWISGMAESSFPAQPAVMSCRHADPEVCQRCAAELHSDRVHFEHSESAPEAQRVLPGEI